MSPVVNLPDTNQHWNSMPPSPKGSDNMLVSDQHNLSYTNNYSQMPTLSPTVANPNIAHGLDYMQQCNVEMQLPMGDVCQNDKNPINESTVFIADTVANSEFIDSENINNVSQFEENQESVNDGEQIFRDSEIMTADKRDYSPLPSSPKQFVGTDFRKEYIQIRNRDTRRRYKIEFSRNYDRYRELHCKIEKVSKRFSDLESQLRREREGSQSFKRMAEKVQKEYQSTKGRPEFQAMRQEFEYLHEKMAHIKLLVQEFDKRK
jgi:RNA polymerase II elongation factor ELL